jgi:hypothetical protein
VIADGTILLVGDRGGIQCRGNATNLGDRTDHAKPVVQKATAHFFIAWMLLKQLAAAGHQLAIVEVSHHSAPDQARKHHRTPCRCEQAIKPVGRDRKFHL